LGFALSSEGNAFSHAVPVLFSLVVQVEFDFDKIEVLGFGIDLPKGKAAEVSQITALSQFPIFVT
jgi:hypothetical protein